MKKKLSATTPHGVFTRRTDRAYRFVVVQVGRHVARLEAMIADHRARYGDGSTMAPVWERALAEQAANGPKVEEVSWSGRRDLAEKKRVELAQYGPAFVYPVDGTTDTVEPPPQAVAAQAPAPEPQDFRRAFGPGGPVSAAEPASLRQSAREAFGHNAGFVVGFQVQSPVGGFVVVYDRRAGFDCDADARWIAMHEPTSLHVACQTKTQAVAVARGVALAKTVDDARTFADILPDAETATV